MSRMPRGAASWIKATLLGIGLGAVGSIGLGVLGTGSGLSLLVVWLAAAVLSSYALGLRSARAHLAVAGGVLIAAVAIGSVLMVLALTDGGVGY